MVAIAVSLSVLAVAGLALLLGRQEKPNPAYRVIEPDRVIRRKR